MNTPLIKWTGSKRPVASKIISYFPDKINTYYEPFLGGGSIFLELLKKNHSVNRFELSDINESLIDVFMLVKTDPQSICISYREMWNELQKDANFFYIKREEYNKTKDPLIFYFLTRTCYNGTIRYNSKGDFNTSYHFSRSGMAPDKVDKVILHYNSLMRNKDISFAKKSYDELNISDKKDVLFLDPPYTNSKSLYHGNINFKNYLKWINQIECNWYMTLNGINKKDNEENIDIPYSYKILINSGKSSFSRMKKNDIDVKEYFYYKTNN